MNTSRTSVLTLNMWGKRHLAQRTPIIHDCLSRFQPDVVCLQEAPISLQELAASSLKTHQITETTHCEIAILWNSQRFTRVAQGTLHLPKLSDTRPLTWVHLHDKANNHNILVATAHYTWPGHADEIQSHTSPRSEQAQATVDFLSNWANTCPVIFTGDLNESVHPRRILHNAGFEDAFTRLGLMTEPTRPAPPWDTRPPEVDDWIVSSADARPTAAFVVHHHLNGFPPSDHWPVFAEFTFA